MESKAKLLGHPIHPMLIPFPLGLLGMAVIFDLLAVFAGQESLGEASRPMIAAGIITGLVAAVPGAIDWAAIPSGTRAKGIATTHGLGNVLIVVCSPSPGGCVGRRRARHPVSRWCSR